MSALSSNGPIRAAQYLRMSDDNQRYSTEIQQDAIAEYAQKHILEMALASSPELS
jgi:DNA invertase Pin-like site-specific DNA recombinase